MIVKNEAHVIRRCLASALPLLDFILVADTGSTDGTQEVIRSFMREHGLPGEVVDEPWRDFAHNRSSAMEWLRRRPEIDYGLMLDADNYLIFGEGFDAARFKKDLKADLYDVMVRTAEVVHYSPLLFSNRLPFHYRGVLHEFLDGGYESRGMAGGFLSEQVQDSARNRNPNKYRDDVAVLEKALAAEDDPMLARRYTFYLAQSHRDAGNAELSLENYLKRSGLGGWEEEVFVSFQMAGKLAGELGRSRGEVIQHFLDAFEACPRRAESLHAAARLCREAGRYHQAYLFAKEGVAIPMPQGALFGEPWIYRYGMEDELAVAAYWTGRYREAFDVCLKLLKGGALPEPERARVHRNACFAVEKLGRPKLVNLLPHV